jgi:hypothetical protein
VYRGTEHDRWKCSACYVEQAQETTSAVQSWSVALVVFGCLSAVMLCLVGVVLALPTLGPSHIRTTMRDAATIRMATTLFRAENGDDGACPSVEELISGDYLDRTMRIQDGWGNNFRIACGGRAIHVDSAGPDENFGTRDDVNQTWAASITSASAKVIRTVSTLKH